MNDQQKNEPGDQQQLVDQANAALEHIDKTPDAWLTVIDAYAAGRNLAMVRSGSNRPIGRGYGIAFNQWVARTGFDMKKIDEQTRTAMGKIIDDRTGFDEWLKTLTPSQRQMWNHPRTLLRHFEQSRRDPKKTLARASKDTLKDDLRKALAELAVLRAEKGKGASNALLIDLDKDRVDDIVETIMAQPKALRDPRKIQDIGKALTKAAGAALRRRADELNNKV